MLKKALDNNRLAIVDLGSNTFHIIIVEKQVHAPYFKVIKRQRDFVYIIGKNSTYFDSKEIKRAKDVISQFKKIADNYNAKKIITVATAAFRMAKNGTQLLSELEILLRSKITILSGLLEAEYIYKGVQLMPLDYTLNNLIMDIGGGSIELILFGQNKTNQIKSFKAGISYLRHNFQISEPITIKEKNTLKKYLDSQFKIFFNTFTKHFPTQLIGSSGPFEIIENINNVSPNRSGNIFKRKEVLKLCKKITSFSKDERFAIDRMPENRADLSKESFLLVEYILESISTIESIIVCPFSIKEGIVVEYYNLV